MSNVSDVIWFQGYEHDEVAYEGYNHTEAWFEGVKVWEKRKIAAELVFMFRDAISYDNAALKTYIVENEYVYFFQRTYKNSYGVVKDNEEIVYKNISSLPGELRCLLEKDRALYYERSSQNGNLIPIFYDYSFGEEKTLSVMVPENESMTITGYDIAIGYKNLVMDENSVIIPCESIGGDYCAGFYSDKWYYVPYLYMHDGKIYCPYIYDTSTEYWYLGFATNDTKNRLFAVRRNKYPSENIVICELDYNGVMSTVTDTIGIKRSFVIFTEFNSNFLRFIKYANGKLFVTVSANSGNKMYVIDTDTAEVNSFSILVPDTYCYDVTYAYGKYVMIGRGAIDSDYYDNTPYIRYSSDGVTWNEKDISGITLPDTITSFSYLQYGSFEGNEVYMIGAVGTQRYMMKTDIYGLIGGNDD